MKKQKDRLVELMGECFATYINVTNLLEFEKRILADYILANGVIVPPCKVGDVVYYLNRRYHISLYKNTIYEAKVVRIVTTSLGTALVIHIRDESGCCEVPDIRDWGITVFLSREEAEAKLKEGVQG